MPCLPTFVIEAGAYPSGQTTAGNPDKLRYPAGGSALTRPRDQMPRGWMAAFCQARPGDLQKALRARDRHFRLGSDDISGHKSSAFLALVPGHFG
jgi:hypothetical protein